MVAEIIAGQKRRFDPVAIPAVCFTEPEIVSVGVDAVGDAQIVGQSPFQANGRALSVDAGEDGGFVRTIADKASGRIAGIQAVGRHISKLVGEFVALVEMGATLEDLAGIIHAHPTLGEAAHESGLKALGHALHISRNCYADEMNFDNREAAIRFASDRTAPLLVRLEPTTGQRTAFLCSLRTFDIEQRSIAKATMMIDIEADALYLFRLQRSLRSNFAPRVPSPPVTCAGIKF